MQAHQRMPPRQSREVPESWVESLLSGRYGVMWGLGETNRGQEGMCVSPGQLDQSAVAGVGPPLCGRSRPLCTPWQAMPGGSLLGKSRGGRRPCNPEQVRRAMSGFMPWSDLLGSGGGIRDWRRGEAFLQWDLLFSA